VQCINGSKIGAGRIKAFRKKGRKTTDIPGEIQESGRQYHKIQLSPAFSTVRFHL